MKNTTGFADGATRAWPKVKMDEKCGVKAFVLSPGEREAVVVMPEHFEFIVEAVRKWIKEAKPGESAQIECTTIKALKGNAKS